MSRPVAILRPEPGNGETARRVAERGLAVIRLPLFEVVPVDWDVPDPAGFDALILTSANSLRHGGAGLAALRGLPVHAVGEATAAAARAYGFGVMTTGRTNAADLIAEAARQGVTHALHLGGREGMVSAGGIVRQAMAVYASEPARVEPMQLTALIDAVAMLHSARAAARLAALAADAGIDRGRIRLAALSTAVAEAAGEGWGAIGLAAQPSDGALIDIAARLAD